MSKVVLLGLTILFSAVFLVIPDNNEAPLYALFWLNTKAEITLQTWVYFLFEHATVLCLAYIVASEARQYKLSCKTFFWLQLADTLDYLLTYNTVWFHLGLMPISMNVVKVLIFGFVVFHEYNSQK